jgi:hypothetical protein
MTNTPGDAQPPRDDQPTGHDQPAEQPGGATPPPEQSGYWQQQAQQPPGYQQPQQPAPWQAAPQAPLQYAPDHPKATTSLVLGILSVVVCGVLGPFAWSIGKRTVNEIDASGGRLGGRGSAQAGYVLGIVGTVFLALGVLYLVVLLVIFAGGIISTSTNS